MDRHPSDVESKDNDHASEQRKSIQSTNLTPRHSDTDTSRSIKDGTVSSHLEKGDTISPLASIGLEQHTKRYIGAMETIAAGFSICLSWAGVAAVLGLVVAEGGFVTLLYGLILIFIMYACIVGTAAELASVYPTAGGQYHWTNILARGPYARALSYACGTINAFSWIGICAGVCSIIPQIVLAIAIQYNPTYIPKRWHFFLVYEAFNVLCIALNIFVMRRAMWLYNFALGFSIVSIITILATVLSRAETFLPSEDIWAHFTNESGWSSDGLVFLIGLIVPNYMYTGIDGAVHLAEECVNGHSAVPRALISTWLIGFITAFGFNIAMAYCVQDLETAFTSLVPVYEIFIQASRSVTAATILIVAVLVIGTIATAGCYQTASRVTWSLARDNALLGSKYMGIIHPHFEAPIWAIFADGFVVFIIGCIYLGSTSAFDAILSSGIVLNLLTFTFPAALSMLRGRSERYLPKNRWFRLPSVLGWICNVVTLVFPFVTLVFYDFPQIYPVTGSNMNYTSAVLGVMAIFSVFNWFAWAKGHYVGPNLKES